jgi:hypothetical protein
MKSRLSFYGPQASSALMAAVNAERIAGFPSGRLFLDSVEQALAVTLVSGHAVRHRSVPVPPVHLPQEELPTIDGTDLEKGGKKATRWQSKLIRSANRRHAILRSTHAILRIMCQRRLWQAL